MRAAAAATAILLAWCPLLKANAQSAPALPASMIAGRGETKSNSLTTGQRSSLSISNSSSIGSSVNVSATDGYNAKVNTSFVPSSGNFTSSFGGENGIIRADVTNIRSETATGYTSTGDGLQTNGSRDSVASGEALVEGIKANISTALDPAKTNISATADAGAAGDVGNSNAAGSLNMNNSMNVDVSNTNFSNAFSQAF
jgi:hypothetical protein